MKMRHPPCALLLLLAFGVGEAYAQANVEPRVERLEQTIRALERRVENLEEQLARRNALAPVPPDRMNWRKLQRGMPEGEVEALLGSPSRVDAMGPFTTWYYGTRSSAQVMFEAKTRTVYSWREPE